MRATAPPAVLIAVLAAFGACSDPQPEPEPNPEPVETVVTSPAPSVTPTGTAAVEDECENQAAVVADPVRRLSAPTRVDIDGDTVPENVFIAFDPTAPVGCQAFIVVQILDDIYSAAIWEKGPESGLPRPSIYSFVDLNGVPGSEILVAEAAGASTQFLGAFVLEADALSRIRITGANDSRFPEVGDLFPYGGSVGHLETTDCAEDGTLVVSTAVPGSSQEDLENGTYSVERTFYRLDGAELRKEGKTRDFVPIERLEQIPEYAVGPFGSC